MYVFEVIHVELNYELKAIMLFCVNNFNFS